MAVRPAALTVAGGGLGGIFLQALLEGFRSSDSSPGLLVPPEPYYPPEPWASESWHLPSLLTGIAIGLSIGPVCELLLDLRTIWGIWLRRQVSAWLRVSLAPVARPPLYREL